jgi:poly-gamma-glutamate synthesis protein (capsule biosynthesis protein)
MPNNRNLTVIFSGFFSVFFLYIIPTFSVPEYSSQTVSLNTHQTDFHTYETLQAEVVNPSPYNGLVFVGDILLARNVEVLMNRFGSQYPIQGFSLQSTFSQPAIIGNFESAIAVRHFPTPAYMMRFSTDAKNVAALAEAGFTHVSLANNHSFDYGEVGYTNAVTVLSDAKIKHFGRSGQPDKASITYLDSVAGKIAIVALETVTSPYQQSDIALLMAEARDNSAFQIVYPHWGVEYQLTHNPYQKKLAETLISLGADLIIGHHPHVVQDVDVIDGVIVFYSLGNYIFDQYFSDEVLQGLVVTLDVEIEPSLSLLPVTSQASLSQPRLMTKQKSNVFLTRLARHSHPALRQQIIAGKILLPVLVATSPEMAIIEQ